MVDQKVLDDLMIAFSEANNAEKMTNGIFGEENVFARITGFIGDGIRRIVFDGQEGNKETEKEFLDILFDEKTSAKWRVWKLAKMSDRVHGKKESAEAEQPKPVFLSQKEIEKRASNPEGYKFRCILEPAPDPEATIQRLKAVITEREKELKKCVNELCYRCEDYIREHEGACNGCRWRPIREGKFE